MPTSRLSLVSLALLLLLAACGGGSTGGTGASTTGTLVVKMQDAPVDGAENVFVTIARVEVFRSTEEGEVREVLVDTPAQYDLLELQNGVTAVLGDGELPVGDYEAIRLIILADSKTDIDTFPAEDLNNYIVIDGEAYALIVPSGAQTGIKLQHDFSITADAIRELTLDFDVRQSVHRRGHQPIFNLRPTIRMIDTIVSGHITGTVTTSDASPLPEGTVVSAHQGGVEVASGFVDVVTGEYRIGPLLAGTYDLLASAPGYGFSSLLGVVVVAQQDSTGNDLTLTPAATGQVDGTLAVTTTLLETVNVVARWEGFAVATVAPDPLTGAYLFDALPEGDYTIEAVFEGGLESGPATVTGGSTTTVDLTLP
jgi:hypothetical protein